MHRRALSLLLISLFAVAAALQLARGLDAAVLPATPVLSIAKAGPAYALPGAPVTYSLTLTNSGTTTATEIFVVDQLPTGATYVSGGELFEGQVFFTVTELAPGGGSATLMFVVTATQTITNDTYQAASFEGAEAFGEVVVVTQVGEPALSIAKLGPAYAPTGAPITYTLWISNAGAIPATSLVITDSLPPGAAYLAGGALVGDVVSWTVPSLDADAIVSVTFAVTATADISNALYAVTAADGYGAQGSVIVNTAVSSPSLAIVKAGPSQALSGSPITYTLTVTNSGTMTATNLVITDELPLGASYVSGGMLVGNMVRWTVPALAPAANLKVRFVVTATAPITNTLYGVTSDGEFGASGAVPVTTFVGAPDLALGKTGPAQALSGSPITYTLGVTNSGTLTATNLVITDQLPLGASYLSGGVLVGDVVSWTVPALPASESVTVTFTVTATETITNESYAVAADDGYGAVGTASVVTAVGEPLLSIEKVGPAFALPGEPITYALTITNSGTTTATLLLIADEVPTGASYVSGGSLSGGVVSWTLDELPPDGVTATVGFVVTATQTITNDIYMVSSSEGAVANGEVTVVTRVGEPLLSIEKEGPAGALIGAPIIYTLTVINAGVVPATNLVITDQLPVGATYVSGGALVGDVVSWTVPALGPAATASVAFVVTATQTITNESYAVTADGAYGAAGSEPVVTVVGEPMLAITKTGPETVLAAEPIVYDLTVTNAGVVPATNLVITDQLPAGATYVSGGALVGDVVSWTVPALGPAESLSVTFVVMATDTVTNDTYAVTADGGYGAVGLEPVVTVVVGPVLTIVKTAPSEVLAGDPFTYTLTVGNAGAVAATNLVIADELPAGASYISGGSLSGGVVTWSIPVLGPGDTVDVTFVVKSATAVVNETYLVMADGGYGAIGAVPITTNVMQRRLYIPVFLNNVVYSEPNDVCDDAFRIFVNRPDHFLADDVFDWYVFDLATTGSVNVTISLTDFAPVEGQMVVYRGATCGSLSVVGQNGDFSPTKTVTLPGQTAGRYYILIVNDGPINHQDLYQLRVTIQ